MSRTPNVWSGGGVLHYDRGHLDRISEHDDADSALGRPPAAAFFYGSPPIRFFHFHPTRSSPLSPVTPSPHADPRLRRFCRSACSSSSRARNLPFRVRSFTSRSLPSSHTPLRTSSPHPTTPTLLFRLLTVTSSHTTAHSQSLLLLLPFAINMATRCYRALLPSALSLHNTVPLVFLFYPPFFLLSFRRHGAFRDSTPHASFLPPSPTRPPFSSYSAPSTYHPPSPPLGILSLLIPSIFSVGYPSSVEPSYHRPIPSSCYSPLATLNWLSVFLVHHSSSSPCPRSPSCPHTPAPLRLPLPSPPVSSLPLRRASHPSSVSHPIPLHPLRALRSSSLPIHPSTNPFMSFLPPFTTIDPSAFLLAIQLFRSRSFSFPCLPFPPFIVRPIHNPPILHPRSPSPPRPPNALHPPPPPPRSPFAAFPSSPHPLHPHPHPHPTGNGAHDNTGQAHGPPPALLALLHATCPACARTASGLFCIHVFISYNIRLDLRYQNRSTLPFVTSLHRKQAAAAASAVSVS
ncbi:hypothetical protein C8J57DRAFT_1611343 [Mycena rebaudengoi]|nr:hypothetical protein C8J57DRAFT_1611343 [Mycena rebaudengoi]